jgi:hypothetical protein
MVRPTTRALIVACAMVSAAIASISAQVTTGTGYTIKDAQGGVLPGATLVLTSETRGTRSAPVVTNATGDYVFPNVSADTYTLDVAMSGFKTLKRTGVAVSAGDRVAVPAITLDVGGQPAATPSSCSPTSIRFRK